MTTQKYSSANILRYVDLTDLSSHSTSEDIAKLCVTAVKNNVAAVCVWPRFVRGAAYCLAGHNIKVATVVNFPSGDLDIDTVVQQTTDAIADGADEIDLVLPYKALIAGDSRFAGEMVRKVVAAAGNQPVKVIIESGELPSLALVREAAELSFMNGATFVKTSTGKTEVGATLEAAEMLYHVAKEFEGGVKISGGVKTMDQAIEYLSLASYIMGRQGLTAHNFRFGASSLVTNLGDY